jgi:DNA topoisomerase-3
LARCLRQNHGRRRRRRLEALPALSPEDNAQAKTISVELHDETTKPPPRYTEATLLSAMEGAGKLVDDESMARR